MDEERCCGLGAEGCQMVRSTVQVRSGAARFSVAVQAESIERALEIVKKQNLGRNCDVTFAINSEVFFAAEPVAASGSARPGRSAAKPGGRVFNLL
jgi:hypothetical protein